MIEEIDEIRWDVRPAPQLGTVEVRVCDGVSTLAEMRALVALTHCLVVDLSERLDRGEKLPTMPPWHVQENKWRAARYGLDAWIILDEHSNERLMQRRPRTSSSSGWPRWPSGSGAPTSSPWSRRSRAAARRTSGSGRSPSAPAATWSRWSTRWCASSERESRQGREPVGEVVELGVPRRGQVPDLVATVRNGA